MSSFGLSYAPSETLGFIPEKLERLTAIMARQVEEKKAPGVSMLIARHGKIAYRQSVGALRPGGPPMTDDAIFRIYSMTKPIVSVAAMMLVEEGRLLITDPVSKYIPAFANLKVGVVNGDKLDLAPLKRPITVQDLMRHTSGLTYGFTGASPVQKADQGGERRQSGSVFGRKRRGNGRASAHASAGRGLGVQPVHRRARTRDRGHRRRSPRRGVADAHFRAPRNETTPHFSPPNRRSPGAPIHSHSSS